MSKKTKDDKLVYIEDLDPNKVVHVDETGHGWTRREVDTPTPNGLEHEIKKLDIKRLCSAT